jgi:hypothetical protein
LFRHLKESLDDPRPAAAFGLCCLCVLLVMADALITELPTIGYVPITVVFLAVAGWELLRKR